MADAHARPKLQMIATFSLDEGEARALDAMIGYGGANLLRVVQEHLGKSYIEGHEADLVRLCDSLRTPLGIVLRKFDDARAVFDGSKIAVRPEPAALRATSQGTDNG